jgi:hypothetical protein
MILSSQKIARDFFLLAQSIQTSPNGPLGAPFNDQLFAARKPLPQDASFLDKYLPSVPPSMSKTAGSRKEAYHAQP